MWGACLENMRKYRDAINKYQTIIDIAPHSIQAKKAVKSIEMASNKLIDVKTK